MIPAYIDRFEESFAVLYLGEEMKKVNFPKAFLPAGLKEGCFSIDQCFLPCLRATRVNPRQFFLQLVVDVLVKGIGRYKMFLMVVQQTTLIHFVSLSIVSNVLIIQKSSDSDGADDFLFLLFRWGYLCLECLQQCLHPLLSVFCICAVRTVCMKIHEVYLPYPAPVPHVAIAFRFSQRLFPH